MGSDTVEVIQYLVDTRALWPAALKTKELENEVCAIYSYSPSDLGFDGISS